MSLVDAVDIPFLKLSDPKFSMRSKEVRESARAELVCAHPLWHRGPAL